MRAMALMMVLALPAIAAEPMRLLLSVGSNVGNPDDVVLRYADLDAQRFRDAMVEVGHVAASRAYLLEEATADDVRSALTELTGRAAELSAANVPTQLFVYLSAHARDGMVHLRGTTLTLAELRERVQRVTSELRLLVLDTCDSGAVARKKGGALTRPFEVTLEQVPLRGEVVISSSGPGESSEEWDSLGSSLFTYHLLTGLRGDADTGGDGRVTLSEAYAYANARTISSAALSQHPVADIDLSGSGELLLTDLNDARTALILPKALEGRFLIVSQPRARVMLEVDKAAGRAVRLAVPAGRYQVQKRAGASVGLLDVELPFGGVEAIDERRLVMRHFADVAVKGAGTHELRSSSVLLGATVTSAPIVETGARVMPSLGWRHSWGALWVSTRLGVGWAAYRAQALTISEVTVAGSGAAGWRFLQWPLVPFIGGGVEISLLSQDFIRDREAELEATFGTGRLPTRRSPGVAPFAVAGVELPLPWQVVVIVQVEAKLAWLRVEHRPEWTAGLGGTLLLGWRF